MIKTAEEILNNATKTEATVKDWQEMLALFHQENVEYLVKGKLENMLENLPEAEKEEFNVNLLFDRTWSRIREKEKKEKVAVFRLDTWLKVAAALVLGIFIGSLFFHKAEKAEPIFYTSMAPKGSVSQMILPDSTFICLNSGSSLKYTYSGEGRTREVFLDGEAWFDVRKSAKRPFIVHTGFYDVNVTGTEFNVKAYSDDNEVLTTLEEGTVEVTPGRIRLQETVILKPGEQLSFNKETLSVVVKKVNTQWFTSWKDNKLIFVNMNLKELMVLLERKYGVDIRMDDPMILSYHYDGTLKNETILEVLNLLRETLPIRYKINNQVIEIKRK